MIPFLSIFIILTLLYHILVTTIGFGFFDGAYPQIPALARDGLRVIFFGICTIANLGCIKTYWKKWRKIWISFLILIAFSVLISYFKDKSVYDMFIGFKYGFHYLFILLTASFGGYILIGNKSHRKQEEQAQKLKRFFERVIRLLVITVVIGFIWQAAKLIWPDLFFHIGYGTLDDFHFGAKPPIYYLTGLGGTLRLQGIFSGPNNYGYFLVAFLPLILSFFTIEYTRIKELFTSRKNIVSLLVWLIWFSAIACTLSRSALIGTAVVLGLRNINFIKKHRKISIGIAVLFILGILGLSILKGSSTLAHITAKFTSINYVIQQPLGYGLGSSGPAVHHNGTILPENYFVQLMIDIGTLGFIFWAIVVGFFMKLQSKIIKIIPNEDPFRRYLKAFIIGRTALLIMGMFLHVFEDSMINYSFFVLRGILLGYTTHYHFLKE